MLGDWRESIGFPGDARYFKATARNTNRSGRKKVPKGGKGKTCGGETRTHRYSPGMQQFAITDDQTIGGI